MLSRRTLIGKAAVGAAAAVALGAARTGVAAIRPPRAATAGNASNAHGRTYRIHVCRNDGTPRGLIYTRRLDLVVMNGGRGDLPTDEGFAQAVARLARVVAKNERRAADGVLAELLPHAERLQRFAG